MNYSLQQFLTHLTAIRADLKNRNGSDHEFLNYICECDAHQIRSILPNIFYNQNEADCFYICSYLEALLQSGIHCYDHQNHRRYLDLVKVPIMIHSHGGGGSTPQALLLNVKTWRNEHSSFLRHSINQHFPTWAERYNRTFGARHGHHIISRLASDPDVWRSFPDGSLKEPLTVVRESLSQIAGPDAQAV